MRKIVLATTAMIIMVSAANADLRRFNKTSSARTTMTTVNVIAGMAIGGALGGTARAAAVGGALGGAATVAIDPKLRGKATKITKTLWNGDK